MSPPVHIEDVAGGVRMRSRRQRTASDGLTHFNRDFVAQNILGFT